MLLTDATITEVIHIWGVWVGETYTCYINRVKLGRVESLFKDENSETQKIVVMDKQTNRTTGHWTNRPTTNWPLVQQASRPRGQWINRPINRQRFTGLRAHD